MLSQRSSQSKAEPPKLLQGIGSPVCAGEEGRQQCNPQDLTAAREGMVFFYSPAASARVLGVLGSHPQRALPASKHVKEKKATSIFIVRLEVLCVVFSFLNMLGGTGSCGGLPRAPLPRLWHWRLVSRKKPAAAGS